MIIPIITTDLFNIIHHHEFDLIDTWWLYPKARDCNTTLDWATGCAHVAERLGHPLDPYSVRFVDGDYHQDPCNRLYFGEPEIKRWRYCGRSLDWIVSGRVLWRDKPTMILLNPYHVQLLDVPSPMYSSLCHNVRWPEFIANAEPVGNESKVKTRSIWDRVKCTR